MVHVLPVPALASSRVVPTSGSGPVTSRRGEGGHSAATRSRPVSSGSQTRHARSGRPASSQVAERSARRRRRAGGRDRRLRGDAPLVVGVGDPLALGAGLGRDVLAEQGGGRGPPPRRARWRPAAAAGGTGPRRGPLDQRAQQVEGGWSSGPDSARRGPARSRPTACPVQLSSGWPALSASRSTHDRQPLLGLEPRPPDGDQPVAVHAGDGAGSWRPSPRSTSTSTARAAPAAEVGGAGEDRAASSTFPPARAHPGRAAAACR